MMMQFTRMTQARKAVAVLILVGIVMAVGAAAFAASEAGAGDAAPKIATVAKPAPPAPSPVVVEAPVVVPPPVVLPPPVAPPLVVPPPAPKPVVKVAPKPAPKPVVQAPAPPPPAPVVVAPPVVCLRLTDAKINWLLGQIATTRANHPELAAGITKLENQLRASLGRNMCAAEAQAMIGSLCLDPAVVQVLNQMLNQLPPFQRHLVGDPCTADLVAVMNKMGAYVPGLASSPS
jgi:hypothetical protein